MLSPIPENNSPEMIDLLAHNQEVLQILLAFMEMSRGFKVAFAEVNFPPDIDVLLTAIQEHSKCASIQFEVLHFDDPDLRFLLEEIKQRLPKINLQPDKKLVLILRGLEKSIAYSGDNPPILTNLNYARDSFPVAIPHPVLFVLPDYAVTRLARFAPDFWAWTTATFRFQTPPATTERLTMEVANYSYDPNRYFSKPEQGERIDLLERLLQEYQEDTEASSRTRLELLIQLGQAYSSIREFAQAKLYFQQAVDLSRELGYPRGEASVLNNLGIVYYSIRKFEEAKLCFQQSLAIKEEIGDKRAQANSYYMLGMIAQNFRQYTEARKNYKQALAIYIEYNNRYAQASIYHSLGGVAQKLREYEEARENYQQALAIYAEFGDRYSQAETYHNLGIVAQVLQEYSEALESYQQALKIKIEFDDRYSQASTYQQLGSLAQALREYHIARENYQQALQIKIEYGDRYSQASTYHQLGIAAQKLGEYVEARSYFQQALQIKIEYGDRYEQAGTYFQLGRVSEELKDFPEAKNNFLQALLLWQEFKDEYSIQTFSIPALSRLYQATQDETLIESMAQILAITPEKARQAIKPLA